MFIFFLLKIKFIRYNIGMYIRRVTRKNKDGTTVAYLQLAHNEWDPKDK
ncbi:Transposase [Geobacillus sp. WSUCF1]|nr:Transposase [Geobacillus sp. WSUCF1]